MRPWQSTLLGIILFVALWQLLAVLIDASSILPLPGEVLLVLLSLAGKKATLTALLHTAWKVLVKLVLVLFLGIALGLVLGIKRGFYEMFRPVIMVFQSVPVISWLSLVILAWGIGWRGPIFIAFISLLPAAILTTVSGVESLDKNLLEMARVYNVPRQRIFKDIYLGSLVPFIIAIVDVCLGQAWKVILVAEYLSGNTGLGVQIAIARWYVEPSRIWALTLLAVLLGLLTERIVKYYLRKVAKKWAQA